LSRPFLYAILASDSGGEVNADPSSPRAVAAYKQGRHDVAADGAAGSSGFFLQPGSPQWETHRLAQHTTALQEKMQWVLYYQ
jgi:hypothetical protein